MKNLNLIFVALILAGLASCKKSHNPDPVSKTPDVYVAGIDNGNPAYWKNGIETMLSMSSGSDTFMGGYASDITFSGNDVYISGAVGKPDGSNVPAYWKNGVLNILTSAVQSASADAKSIAVDGTNIYAGGSQNTATLNAVLWKNGVPTARGGHYSQITSVLFDNGSLYYTGPDEIAGNYSAATYFKNDNRVILRDTSSISESLDIFVTGNDVYTTGDIMRNGIQMASYWKNGQLNVLSTLRSTAGNTVVSGSDVYVSGSILQSGQFVAVIWKNGVMQTLTDQTNAYSYQCWQLRVDGNDVYAIGNTAVDQGEIPVIWKNGIQTALPTSAGSKASTAYSYVYAIRLH